MRSISFKLTLLYIFLAIINIAFFTIIIFENQMDLITENTKLKTKELANNIYSQLNMKVKEFNADPQAFSREEIFQAIEDTISPLIDQYILFKEDGFVLHRKGSDLTLSRDILLETNRALTLDEFMGQLYHSQVDMENYEILFYVPLEISNHELDEFILLFKLKMKEINIHLARLYKLVVLMITVIAFIHVFFAVVLHNLLVVPIKNLSLRSKEISDGNLSARVNPRSKDEIGQLGHSFNLMADSVQRTIARLDRQNQIMRMELQMAAKVQKSIYPTVRKTPFFDIAVYHKPYIEVSGDYHNIVPLGEGRYGVIVADVSGHGVAAALITMMIKDRFEESAGKFRDAKDLVTNINTAFNNLMVEFDKFFTAFYLIVDKNEVISFSNAGHPGALLFRPSTEAMRVLDTEGAFIGLPADLPIEFSSKTIGLAPGDKIMIFTDGMTESVNGNKEEYSVERLRAAAERNVDKSCEEILKGVVQDFHSFCDLDSRRDDETLIVIEVRDQESEVEA